MSPHPLVTRVGAALAEKRIIARQQASVASQRVSDRAVGRAVILCYHRIATLEQDPQLLAVRPEFFADHLEFLRQRYQPLPLMKLAARRVPRKSVALTFDDGYADNLEHAAPALEKAGVPATVFIATGYTGGAREFWWDELERVLLVGAPTGELTLRGRGEERCWLIDSVAARRTAYDEIHPWIRAWPTDAIDAVMIQLRQFAGEPEGGRHRASHRQLDVVEVGRLDSSPAVEVGAHTVTHPSLAAQPEDVQRWELAGSKRALEEWVGRPITSVSYPFGGYADHSRVTRRLAKQAGFGLAAANFPGLVGPLSSRWQLPRVLVRDWDASELEQLLDRLLPTT